MQLFSYSSYTYYYPMTFILIQVLVAVTNFFNWHITAQANWKNTANFSAQFVVP